MVLAIVTSLTDRLVAQSGLMDNANSLYAVLVGWMDACRCDLLLNFRGINRRYLLSRSHMSARVFLVLILAIGLSGCINSVLLAECLAERRGLNKPQVKYGEFPFSLTYTHNGTSISISDELICEYAGLMCTGAGWSVKWKRTFRSGKDDIVLLNGAEGERILKNPGSCGYYMNTPKGVSRATDSDKKATLHDTILDGIERWGTIDEEELRVKYGIVITEWIETKPVVQPAGE